LGTPFFRETFTVLQTFRRPFGADSIIYISNIIGTDSIFGIICVELERDPHFRRSEIPY